jgi:flagellar M-ring protein FliF
MASFNQVIGQAKKFWTGLSKKQQWLLIGGGVLTLAVIGVFTALIGKPEYKPLLTGMEPAEAQQVGQKLAAKNIPYQLSTDGKTISVPADKLDSSRLEVASEGMPKSGRLGFELFDKVNWGQTDFDEKVNYQRALEGELERTIQTLNNVESARVHLVLPTDSLFLDRQTAAKASVILKLRNRDGISRDMQVSIARLVAGAVDRLTPEDVTVVDADTNRPFAMPQAGTVAGGDEAGKELAARLVATLEPVVGADHVRASVNVEYDPSTSEENRETYDPNAVVAVSTQRSEEQTTGAAIGGVPGTSSNVPKGKGMRQSAAAVPTGQSSKSENNAYVVNKVVLHTLQPAGRIRRITAALLVDDATQPFAGGPGATRRRRSPGELNQIAELAKAAIGIDSNRGDTLSIQNLSFGQMDAAPTKLPFALRFENFLRDWSDAVRYISLLLLFVLVYFLLIRPILNRLMPPPPKEKKEKEKPPELAEPKVELPAAEQPKIEEVKLPELPKIPEEKQRAVLLKQKLAEKIKAEPVNSTKLVQAWLREGDEE